MKRTITPADPEGQEGERRRREAFAEVLQVGYTNAQLERLRFDREGLVPAVVQDYRSGRVLMLAWMDASCLRRTLDTGVTWFWSRARREYWSKGEKTGNRQLVRRVSVDCDGDTLLVEVDQVGNGACHLGTESCFSRQFGAPVD